MIVNSFHIQGPLEIQPARHHDDRGYFSETFNFAALNKAGILDAQWPQDNQSFSEQAFTLRGLHFQLSPFAQAKLVRVLKGSIYDVAVDLRKSSSTFGKWIGVTLSAEKFNQLYVPVGFAHGFLTLEPNVEIHYKVTNYYSKSHERSLIWNDDALAIDWPLPNASTPLLSAKDAIAPTLEQTTKETYFA